MAARRNLPRIFKLAAALALAALAAGAGLLWWLAPRLGDELASTLSSKLGKPVRLERLRWSLAPGVRFQGRDLAIGEETGEDWFAKVSEFELEAGWSGLLATPRRIGRIVLRDSLVRTGPGPTQPKPPESEPGGPPPPARAPAPPSAPALAIREASVVNLTWERLSREPGKPPQTLLIRNLLLSSFDFSRPTPFEASLRYPRPPGELELKGEFGPWSVENPRRTPYRAAYRFQRADLSVFGGIRGILEASGSFEGTIDETRVAGGAEIPDFALTKPDSLVPLSVRYTVSVKERGRRISLEEVVTDFLQSRLICQGEIFGSPAVPGRTVSLRVSGRGARVEDLIRFGSNTLQPPLTGAIDLDASVEIPPGPERFRRRMRVEGTFQIAEGRFANVSVQDTLAKISRAGGGQGTAEEGSSVVSDMSGDFVLQDDVIRFSRLRFGVPGVAMDLVGSYAFEGEALDFSGTALLQRSPSELAPEGAGKWIQLIDPVFRRGKFGTSVPVTIRGSRARPVFRIDYGRIGRP